MVFGRKGTAAAAKKPRPDVPDGHRHVLELLDREEAEKPLQRAQMGGMVLFDLALKVMNCERGVHIESLVAALASCGGAACLDAAFADARASGKSLQDAGFHVVEGKDGRTYYYSDQSNSYLLESQYALLSLALGAAQQHGAPVTIEMLKDAAAHAARTVGGPGFGVPRKIDGGQVPDLPANWVKAFRTVFSDALTQYEVPPQQRPAAFGFALHRAIDAGKQAADPYLLAQVAVECAVPMAKVEH